MAPKTTKAADETKLPQMGDVLDKGTLPDGRPWHDIFLAADKTYRLTRILVPESDEAWDAAQNDDGTTNGRLLNRMQLAASIVNPPTTIDDFSKLTAIDLDALFRAYGRLNYLPPADSSGNA